MEIKNSVQPPADTRGPAEPPKRLPLAHELTGSDPDFAGDLSTEEYIAELRGHKVDTRESLNEVLHKDSACVACGCSQTLPVNLQRCRCVCHPRDREPNVPHWRFDPKAIAAFDYLQEIGVNGDEAREYLMREPAESPKKYCPVCRDDDFYCSCPVPGKSAELRCFTCDLRLSECECGPTEPYSGRPAELAPLQQIYQIAERALAEPPESGSDTGTLIAICTLIEVPPGRPAEPVREWRLVKADPRWLGYSGTVPSEEDADEWVKRWPGTWRKEWRYAAGPWQDADTSAQ